MFCHHKAFGLVLIGFLIVPTVSNWALCQESEDREGCEDAPVKPGDQVLFREVIPNIKSKTRVPIMVPSELPAPLKYRDAHLVSGEGVAAKYRIDLYYDCPGSGANFMGYFSGEKLQRKPRFGVGFFERVQLINGIAGYFHDVSCGGSCAPPEIVWVQDGYEYTLQLRTLSESKRAMIRAANSAIRAGAR